jgi:hypothetical protein
VKIIQNIISNDHWATSVSQPGKLHKVTLYSCDCAGFLRHARYMHFAAILEMYASLPPIETPDPGPDGAGTALPVPAPRWQTGPRVENPRVAHAGTRPDGSTYRILHADGVTIDGVPHRVGDAVLVTDRRWGWVPARITCIRTVGSTGTVWKVDVNGTGGGETTRSLAEVRAVSSEAMHVAA